jgi:hypothetical protein
VALALRKVKLRKQMVCVFEPPPPAVPGEDPPELLTPIAHLYSESGTKNEWPLLLVLLCPAYLRVVRSKEK